jgi:hypothetical protein
LTPVGAKAVIFKRPMPQHPLCGASAQRIEKAAVTRSRHCDEVCLPFVCYFKDCLHPFNRTTAFSGNHWPLCLGFHTFSGKCRYFASRVCSRAEPTATIDRTVRAAKVASS